MMIIIFFSPFKVNLVCLLEPVVSPIFDSLILSRYSRRSTHIRTLPTAHVIGAAGTPTYTRGKRRAPSKKRRRRRRRHDNITNRKSLSAPVCAGAVCVSTNSVAGWRMPVTSHQTSCAWRGEGKKDSTAKEFQMTQQPEQQGGEKEKKIWRRKIRWIFFFFFFIVYKSIKKGPSYNDERKYIIEFFFLLQLVLNYKGNWGHQSMLLPELALPLSAHHRRPAVMTVKCPAWFPQPPICSSAPRFLYNNAFSASKEISIRHRHQQHSIVCTSKPIDNR